MRSLEKWLNSEDHVAFFIFLFLKSCLLSNSGDTLRLVSLTLSLFSCNEQPEGVEYEDVHLVRPQ